MDIFYPVFYSTKNTDQKLLVHPLGKVKKALYDMEQLGLLLFIDDNLCID